VSVTLPPAMSEHTFTDLDRQLIVRLSEERLVYAPAEGSGWQCRVADICWTSSRITSRGIQEINLHAVDGRVVVTILPFDGIERFYVTLLRVLTDRPPFDLVRHDLPTQVPLLERILWLTAQREVGSGPWDLLRVTGLGTVGADERCVLASVDPEIPPVRIPWEELAGVRSRGNTSRIYRSRDYVQLGVADLEAPLTAIWDALRVGSTPLYSVPGVRAANSDLAMEFSWELERALADELLDPEETVLAVAYGAGEGSLLPGESGAAIPSAMASLGAVLAGTANEREVNRTELLLTSRRLLEIERDPKTLELLSQVEVPLDRLPRLKQANGILTLGRYELLTDQTHPALATKFMNAYRGLVTERFDPFGDHSDEGPSARLVVAGDRPDPFAPTVEQPLALEN
jgi:hypothetical protein